MPIEVSDFFDLASFVHAPLFKGCDYPWEALERLSTYLQKQKLGNIEVDIPGGVFLIDPEQISIGEGCVIEPGAYIQGPCLIGPRTTIRSGAYLRGGVLTGEGCVIGHATEVKHSIFLNGAAAPHFNYVGDSILGNGVNLGAGVVCANLRFDHKPVSVLYLEEKIPTKMKKLGALIGDEAQVGCNSVLNPGALLGKNAFCFPCLNIGGYIPPHAQVTHSHKNLVKET